MAAYDEILNDWENNYWYTDWYAIDRYDSMTDTITRVYVGTLDQADKLMRDYYSQPNELACQPFFRCSLIDSQSAKAFFENANEGGEALVLDENRYHMSLTEAAAYLGVSRQRAHVLYQQGRISGTKIGKTLVIDRGSVQAYRSSTEF